MRPVDPADTRKSKAVRRPLPPQNELALTRAEIMAARDADDDEATT